MKTEEKKWAVGMLFIGVLMSVTGNLFTNILDRYFHVYGKPYELIVTLLFLGILWYTDKYFTKIIFK